MEEYILAGIHNGVRVVAFAPPLVVSKSQGQMDTARAKPLLSHTSAHFIAKLHEQLRQLFAVSGFAPYGVGVADGFSAPLYVVNFVSAQPRVPLVAYNTMEYLFFKFVLGRF
jgi:hypothetical protein